MQGGRGSGKTRTGAETLADWILEAEAAGEWAVVAPTFGDARDVCIEGPSGLLNALRGAYDRPAWNRSLGALTLRNGAKVYIDGADDGALRIQGKNLSGVWCDEIGLWRDWETSWRESLRFAVRMHPARYVVTGTPKQGHPLVRTLLKDPRVAVTRMRMLDNIDNLDPALVAELVDAYEETRLGRQELEGEFLDEPLGALWTLAQIRALDSLPPPDPLTRIVVGVDPSGTPSEDTGASETGIVVAGFSARLQHGFILDDLSLHGTPQEWGSRVCQAYRAHEADLVVAEKNFGGEMVRTVIHSVDANVPVKLVSASRGKIQRAEPVAARYEQARVHHVREFPRLEEQMVTFMPGVTQDSPDRLDALVWALTELMVDRSEFKQYAAYGAAGPKIVRKGDLVLREDVARERGYSYLDE